MLSLGDRFVGLAKTKTFKMITVETVNSGLTHFPMGRGNYLHRGGIFFVRLILAAVLLGGAVSQEGGGGSGKEEGDSFCVGEGEVESGGGVSGWSELGWGGFLILADERLVLD